MKDRQWKAARERKRTEKQIRRIKARSRLDRSQPAKEPEENTLGIFGQMARNIIRETRIPEKKHILKQKNGGE